MKLLKVALVIAGGLGAAWAANVVTGSDTATVVLAQVEEPAASGDASAESDIEELSEAELEAEIARIEAAAGADDEVEEFVPTKPLAADIPISLPSDI